MSVTDSKVTLGPLLSMGLSTPHRLQLVLRAKLTFPHLGNHCHSLNGNYGNISRKHRKLRKLCENLQESRKWIPLTRGQDRANRLPKVCIHLLGLRLRRHLLGPVHHHHHRDRLCGSVVGGHSHPSSYLGAQCPEVRLQIAAHQNSHCLLQGFWRNNSNQGLHRSATQSIICGRDRGQTGLSKDSYPER